ncbi:efflux RND transporter periplasmic adaptor subunit [Celeribacter halophilus]|uniref:RND family efflux transporter, MFP subunit n=1 Tax=Celeribacter halophilus TaxID=576117 RepID=A0A1I3Q1K7_9RHOB|nr:efflux RND transporter periplasmic adaptor subunit [Celeribacter halophilus]SFJ27512.1 RND family efflux transporter, MFP subunit [Celeribacter halophilus]
MRTVTAITASAIILGGAHVLTFGVPVPLQGVLGSEDARVTGPAGAGDTGARQRGGATTVIAQPLTLKPYEDVIRAVGSARALHLANVTTESAGEVVATYLGANRLVEAGDVLLALDPRTQQLALDLAQANLKQAQQTVDRYEQLRANGNLTLTEVALSEAQIALEQAKIEVEIAQVALEDRTVRAPISGRLGLSEVEVGDILSSNEEIVSIDDLSALLIEFELPERAIGLLQKDTTILASTPSFTGKVFEGEIESFDSRLDSVTRSITVRAQIDNSDGLLWSGMTFSVRLIHESEPLPALPATAITWSRAGSNIWIEEDGKAKAVPVVILHRRNETVWVDTDLEPGTMVITEGAQKLREGGAVRILGAVVEGALSRSDTKNKAEVPS